MTVSSEINRKDYAGNGSAVSFATGFRFLENNQLKIILTVDATGVETVKILNTDYSVSGADDDSGGTVTMNTVPALGETLTIKRDMDIVQETEYVEGDNFPAKSHERALDKLTMLIQQAQEEISRSIKLSEGQQSSGLSIPSPVNGLFLQWSEDGNLVNVDISTLGAVAVSDYGKDLILKTTAEEAKDYLDVVEAREWIAGKEYPIDGYLSVYNGDLWKRLPGWAVGDEPGVAASWESYDERINSSGRDVATSTEIRAGTNNEKTITPLGLNETSLGWGQSWQDVSSARSLDTIYTNTTGRPIQVNTTIIATSGSNSARIEIDGVIVAQETDISGDTDSTMSALVPNNSEYEVFGDGTSVVSIWAELR